MTLSRKFSVSSFGQRRYRVQERRSWSRIRVPLKQDALLFLPGDAHHRIVCKGGGPLLRNSLHDVRRAGSEAWD